MIYSERAFFHGDHCQHVADRDEAARLDRANRHVRTGRSVPYDTAIRWEDA